MRLFFLAATCSVLVAAATFACSSSESGPAAAPDAGATKPPPKPAEEETPKPVEETPKPVEEAGVTDPDAAAPTDAAASGGALTTTGDGGAACNDTAFREAEPNNEEGQANTLVVKVGDTRICGVTKNDDPDTITFITPDYNQTFNVNFEQGNPNIAGSIDGKAFTGFNFPPADPGKKWIIKITTNQTTPRPYRLRINFN